MKRALAALPFLALLLGLALFFLRRPQAPAGPHPAPRSTPDSITFAPTPPSKAPDSSPEPAGLPQELGAIRFTITFKGQPAANVPILVMQSSEERHMRFNAEADGTQLLRGLPPGVFSIGIEPPDAMPYRADLEVLPGKTVDVVVDLKSGGMVYGTVTDRAGQPVAGTRIFLLKEHSKTPPDDRVVLSDKDGHYALKGIPPGDFGVRYRNVLYQPLDRMGMVFRNSGDEYRVDVVLEAGASISGRVVDEQNAPLEGAELLASAGDSGATSKSGPDGRFTLTGLFETPANLSAAKPGYGRVVLRNLSGNPTDVLLRLPKAGTLIGRLDMDVVPRQTQIILSRYDDELRQVVPAESNFFNLEQDKVFAFEDIPPGAYWIDVKVENNYEAVNRPQVMILPGKATSPVVISMRKKN